MAFCITTLNLNTLQQMHERNSPGSGRGDLKIQKNAGGHANESGLWMKAKSAMTTGVSQVVKWHRKTELQPQVAETK